MFDKPATWLMAWWGGWALQALWAWYNANLFLRRVRRQEVERKDGREHYSRPAAVIVPVKGVDDRFDEHVRALCNQEYPKYRVIFVVESEEEEAYGRLQAIAKPQAAVNMSVVVAGLAKEGGQKVHNQLRGLEELTEEDQAVVFADADAVPDERWLGKLVFPLYKRSVGATTGYRWMVPADEALTSRVASAINGSIATLLGPDRHNQAWGGSMAMRRTTMEEVDLVSHWRGALSDDYQMSRVIRRGGKRLFFVMRCLIASPVRLDWGRLMEFGRRQYLITRIHAPAIWLIALFGTSLYVGGLMSVPAAAVMQARGWGWGLAAWAAVYVFDQFRGERRAAVVREAMGEEVLQRLRPALALDRWATPLVMAVHWLIIVSSAVGRTIRWSGVTYRIRGRQRVEIVGRE